MSVATSRVAFVDLQRIMRKHAKTMQVRDAHEHTHIHNGHTYIVTAMSSSFC